MDKEHKKEIEIIETKESWSEYKLANGDTIKIKPVVTAIFQLDSSKSATDKNTYTINFQPIVDVKKDI